MVCGFLFKNIFVIFILKISINHITIVFFFVITLKRFKLECSKYRVNIIFCKPAVPCTLLTIYVLCLYMTVFIETVA